jgi:hypothetical protein
MPRSSSVEDCAGRTIIYAWGTIERLNVVYDIRICYLNRPTISGDSWFASLASADIVGTRRSIDVTLFLVATVCTGVLAVHQVSV